MINVKVVGLGYVGLANFCYLLLHHEKEDSFVSLKGYDTNTPKVEAISKGYSPIDDDEKLGRCLMAYSKELKDKVSSDLTELKKSDVLILCLPTDFNQKTKKFDISCFAEVAKYVKSTKLVIVRSTIDFQGWEEITKLFKDKAENIVHMPEFLREGSALSDEINSTKCICSSSDNLSKSLILSVYPTHKINWCSAKEAITIKLASNTYLATRVAFFNEIDTFCRKNDMNPHTVISLMGKDNRIGNKYNRPSFGFGGYCLPKDSSVFAEMVNLPLMNSIQDSNEVRARDIVRLLESKHDLPKNSTIGIFKLSMKPTSSNSRTSAVFNVIRNLIAKGYKVIVFDPTILRLEEYTDYITLYEDFDDFVETSDFIISDFNYDMLKGIKNKLVMGEHFDNTN